MAKTEDFGRAYAVKQINRQSNPLRKLIKSFYVSRVLHHVNGATIDLGCGAGQILERLPSGSLGLEINPYLIAELTKRGLRVMLGTSSDEGFNLTEINPNEFNTLVLSHVLEHFANAALVLRKLLHDCNDLGISTVIIVVPGVAGFRSDRTHKTYVDMAYLRSHNLINCEGFEIIHNSYFPGNLASVGKMFVYHELMVVYRIIRGNT